MITRHLKVHSKNVVNRLSLSFDSAKLPENNQTTNTNSNGTNNTKQFFDSSLVTPLNGINSNLSLSSSTFSLLNRMETTQSFENNNSTNGFKNLENLTNNINKSTSSLTSFE